MADDFDWLPDPDAWKGDKKDDVYSVTLEFSVDAAIQLEGVRRDAGADTYAEVFRDGLRFYMWYLEQRKLGYHIAVVKGDDIVRVVDLSP